MTTEEKVKEEEAMLQGQAQIWKIMFAFADSMALKCAVELGIADIINKHGRSITLSEIASNLSSSQDMVCLSRIMRFLVRKGVFTAQSDPNSPHTLYGLTHSSKWLLRDNDLNLVPMILAENHPTLIAPWHCLAKCVEEGGIAFSKAHGSEIWDFALANPGFNDMFNGAMACTSNVTVEAILSSYGDGFHGVGSVVDVGGGTGAILKEIVKAHPHVKGINFDLPHVVGTAQEYPGVSHVGGDMFVEIPKADVVFMKWILHDWNDEDCVKILKNCRKAVPEKTGKIMVVEIVLPSEGESLFAETGLAFDLLMIAHSSGGRERTEAEWKKLLKEGGFPRYKIIQIPTLLCIIEAYPQ